jgi:hypothetical protein
VRWQNKHDNRRSVRYSRVSIEQSTDVRPTKATLRRFRPEANFPQKEFQNAATGERADFILHQRALPVLQKRINSWCGCAAQTVDVKYPQDPAQQHAPGSWHFLTQAKSTLCPAQLGLRITPRNPGQFLAW